MTHRRTSLRAALTLVLLALAGNSELNAFQASQPPSTPQAPPAKPKQPSPFETVPANDQTQQQPAQPAKPAQPPKPGQPFENVPAEKEEAKPAAPQQQQPEQTPDVIAEIEFRGSRRVPQQTLRTLIFSKQGDKFDEDALHRDFMNLWNSGRFDDLTIEREPSPKGWIIRFVVVERRVVRTIKYEGNKSVTVSEILDRFKERRVGLSVEQQYDQARVARATQVLKEFLSERGRQFATVTPQIRQIPPSSVEVTFMVNEGAKVKVGNIDITGNQVFNDRAVKRAMKNLHPLGIPHSLIAESLFAKTYDSSKLEEDMERVKFFYMTRGYFTAKVTDHKVNLHDATSRNPFMPWLTKPAKVADVSLTIEEGLKYHLNKVNYVGVKLFRTPEALTGRVFGMNEGDVFSTEKLSKGLKNFSKLYGEFGYIDAVADPDFNPMPDGKIDLTLNVDEGKQFFVRRIDFQGNNTTRDKVIRREILIDEGDMYNTRLWELSVLRLNQLGYFEALKAEEAAQITRDTKNNTVDILLKVKERGKNSISLNGGVSGIAGSFIGFGYSTNNFLGLGETLSLNAEIGDRMRSATFGFTEPYLFDKPIQAGFTIYTQRFNYDQGREISLFYGQNLIPLYNQLGTNNLLKYTSNGYGATVFASYPLRRSFARLSLTYGIDRQSIRIPDDNTVTKNYFLYSSFLNFSGPNQLTGIITSKVIPAYQYNTIDHPITPSRGKSFYASLSVAGGPLGGNVKSLEPSLSFTYFHPGLKKGHTVGFRLLGRMISGYGGQAAPPFNRIYMGGENDVRGFEIWSIGPYAYIPSQTSVPVLNSDGSQRYQSVLDANGNPGLVALNQTLPIYQLVFSGGDTQAIGNFEYRIPIFGPVTLAAFYDAGMNRISFRNQLKINEGRLNELNNSFPTAAFDNRPVIVSDTQKLRMSTGLELQIMMPVVNAPFRLYWAYNPMIARTNLTQPVVADATMFPNAATLNNAIPYFAYTTPYYERRTMFRFTISRTF